MVAGPNQSNLIDKTGIKKWLVATSNYTILVVCTILSKNVIVLLKRNLFVYVTMLCHNNNYYHCVHMCLC